MTGTKSKVYFSPLGENACEHCFSAGAEKLLKADENGDGVFGHIVLSFIDKVDGVKF